LPQMGQERAADVLRSISFISARFLVTAHAARHTAFNQPKRIG
jgi:hypothetical protein